MKTRPSLILIIALALLPGCQRHEATKFFDEALKGHTPYRLPGVTDFEIRSYEIVQSTGDVMVVRLTYGSKLGNDIVETKKFRVGPDGKLQALDRHDVQAAIKANLLWLSLAALAADTPVTYKSLVSTGKLDPKMLHPVEGEDYSAAVFESNKVTVMDAAGEAVVYDGHL